MDIEVLGMKLLLLGQVDQSVDTSIEALGHPGLEPRVSIVESQTSLHKKAKQIEDHHNHESGDILNSITERRSEDFLRFIDTFHSQVQDCLFSKDELPLLRQTFEIMVCATGSTSTSM